MKNKVYKTFMICCAILCGIFAIVDYTKGDYKSLALMLIPMLIATLIVSVKKSTKENEEDNNNAEEN